MECLVGKNQFLCRTLLVGERLDVRSLAKLKPFELHRLATTPLTVRTDGGGVAILFRYGLSYLTSVRPTRRLSGSAATLHRRAVRQA